MNSYKIKNSFENKYINKILLFIPLMFFIYIFFNLSKYILKTTTFYLQIMNINIINVSPIETLSTLVYTTFLLTFIFGVIIFYFFFYLNYKEALTSKEIKYLNYLGLSIFLGLVGGILSYFLSLFYLIPYLLSYNIMISIENYITLEKLFSFLITNFFLFFLVFQIPTILRVLIGLEIISKERLRYYRPIYFLGFLIFASLITPAEIISTIVLAGVGQILYEVSIL